MVTLSFCANCMGLPLPHTITLFSSSLSFPHLHPSYCFIAIHWDSDKSRVPSRWHRIIEMSFWWPSVSGSIDFPPGNQRADRWVTHMDCAPPCSLARTLALVQTHTQKRGQQPPLCKQTHKEMRNTHLGAHRKQRGSQPSSAVRQGPGGAGHTEVPFSCSPAWLFLRSVAVFSLCMLLGNWDVSPTAVMCLTSVHLWKQVCPEDSGANNKWDWSQGPHSVFRC